MSIEDTELLAEFVVESVEHLENVETQLLSLEINSGEVDHAVVNNVFRAVHSIKGAAGFLGLETLQSLAHRGEEVLNRLRTDEIRPTPKVVSTLLAATDRLKSLLSSIATSNEQDVSDHLRALEQLLSIDNSSASTSASDNAGGVVGSLTSVETKPSNENGIVEVQCETIAQGDSGSAKQLTIEDSATSLAPNINEAIREFLIESGDYLEQIDRDLIGLEKNPENMELINVIFRNIHTIKGGAGFLAFNQLERLAHAGENLLGRMRSGDTRHCDTTSNLLFATVDGLRKYLARIEADGNDGSSLADELIDQLNNVAADAPYSPPSRSKDRPNDRANEITDAHSQDLANDRLADQPCATSVSQSGTSGPVGSNAPSEISATSAADTSIRVDVALLDKLMTRVGELVLARNQIMQFTGLLGDTDLLSTSQRLNLITTELQESVMKTRMQPIGNVWSKFPRIVRDLAASCGKEVRIQMEGKETELDKTIIEAIKDPLTHIVRNSVDHGIEKPEARIQKGKSAEGCLLLRAYHEGGQVNIEISDDGAGLNVQRIRSKAVEKGLVSSEQAEMLSDHDAAQLIFLPGFSTAEKISNLSGRGVGMDVVKSNIERIGGVVDIDSQFGQGTVIKIKIPLTLAIIPALVVTNNGNRFAIPQVNLLELVRLEKEQAKQCIEWIQNAPVYRLRGRLLPMVYMHEVLQSKSPQAITDSVNIVVLRADERQFGLVVDQINDTEEIVVKPLIKQLKSIPVFSGATIMGDGKAALILDVIGLADASNVVVKEKGRRTIEPIGHHANSLNDRQTLLVLGCKNNQRLAFPISQVARLEKIEKRRVEHTNGQEVVQYRNEIMPLVRINRVLGLDSVMEADEEFLNVVVYQEVNRSVGLVVDQIIDIVETTRGNPDQTQRTGLLESTVIQERVTDIVDLHAVIRQAGLLVPECGEFFGVTGS